MGSQIIRQPNELFAIFSSITDTIIMWDATAKDVEDYFVDRAAKQERRMVRDILRHVKAGDTRKAYHQFALTWDEALKLDEEHGGEVWLIERAGRIGGGQ